MQSSDHRQRQIASPIEDLRDTPPLPDIGFQIAAAQPKLIHAEENRIHRVRWIDGMVLLLVRFDQRCEDLESVTLKRARRRLPEALTSAKAVS